jgi:hypothetical protein
MPTFLVVLSLVLATAVLGAVSGGIGLAAVLFVVAIAAGFALSGAAEDPFAATSR